MRIFSIVVYSPLTNHILLSASLNTFTLNKDMHTKNIERYLKKDPFYLADKPGIHTLKAPEGIYYGKVEGDKILLIASEQALPPLNLDTLFKKIQLAQNVQALKEIIHNPDESSTPKMQVVQKEVEEVRDILKENIVKIHERGVKLEKLVTDTDKLVASSREFIDHSKALRRQRSGCFSLYFLFSPIKNLLSKVSSYAYDYKPTPKSHK